MKNLILFYTLLFSTIAYTQIPPFNQTITVDKTFNTDTIINPFNQSPITGIGISGNIVFNSDTSFVRIIVGDGLNQYMVYESYPMLVVDYETIIDHACEETCFFDGFAPTDLILQISDALLFIENIDLSDIRSDDAINLQLYAKNTRNSEKLSSVINYIENNNLIWLAEETDFSRLFYSDKAKMWGAN